MLTRIKDNLLTAFTAESAFPYLVSWLGLTFTVIYSYPHIAWFLGRMESTNAVNPHMGALAIELSIVGIQFGLIKQNVQRSRRRWLWAGLVFFGLFSLFANAYHATANGLQTERLVWSQLASLDIMDKLINPILGCWPPVATLIMSLMLPIQAPRRQRTPKKKAEPVVLRGQKSKREAVK